MKNKYYCIFVALVCWIHTNFSALQAQELNTLTVNAPSGISGDYRIARALFGSQSNNTIAAGAFFGSPTQGCTTLTGDGTGKVVFLDRGTCAFDVKSLNAQNSGTVAVVICAVLPNETLQMMPGGNVADQVTIPVFYASKETCDKLRVDLTSGGIHVTFKNKACPTSVSYASNVVWGDVPGVGDFSDGFGDWTTDKGWGHNPEGVIRNGAYTGGPKVVGSETYCNGVAEFNSDFLDNAGMTLPNGQPDREKGTCPSPCTGFLLSPTIVFNKPLEQGLIIEFSQSLRQFQSEYYIMVSKDGGITFPDTVKFNEEYRVNSNHISERKKISFVGYKGVNQLQFKFECIGDYYYWAIDDIVIYDESFVDLQVNREWYSVAPYFKMPKSQVSEIPLMADIKNLGNKNAENTVLEVTINGPSFSQTKELIYGDFPAISDWENRPFPDVITTPATVGRYTAEYNIKSPEEEDAPNNKAVFEWHITENTFANLESEANYGSPYMVFYATPWVGVPDNYVYSIANIYYIPKGKGYEATKARYGFANTMAEIENQYVQIDLFEFIDEDNSNTASPQERVRVGTNTQFISSEIPDLRNVETDIWAVDENGYPTEGIRVQLKDNTHYLISVSIIEYNNPGTDPQIKLLGYTPRELDNYSRSVGHVLATKFALDTLHNLEILPQRACGSLFAFENNFIPLVPVEQRNFRYIFNAYLYTKAFLEMDIAMASNTSETVLPTILVKTFPNPAARDLFVDIHLEKVSETVEVSIFTMDGKLVGTKTFNNVKDDRLKMDVSTFTNGTYNVKVITSEGTANRKVIINN